MAGDEFRVSEESRPVFEPYAAIPLHDVRRVELFSFLAEAVIDPNGIAFEQDDEGLRWTWLNHVARVWRIDLVRMELDIIDAWDEEASD